MICIWSLSFVVFRRHLRETFSIANSNDLNKLTVCALAALGQIFLSLGNTKVMMSQPCSLCSTHFLEFKEFVYVGILPYMDIGLML